MVETNEKWYFPKAKGVGINGFNNIGEEFKDKPIMSLAKEICQNSLDTKFIEEYKKGNGPIRIEFKEFYINKEDFPGINDFKKILGEELKYYSNQRNDKTVSDFYKRAIQCFDLDKIKCLRISDFNTTGLLGSDKRDQSPWCNLVNNVGLSDKPKGSGGSKGQGKFASFICSKLYTVFYSTYAKDELKATCGVARLSGYLLDDYTRIGEGYYRNSEGNIRKCISLDPDFTRDEYGTDIYILGLKDEHINWENQVISSIIDNFLVAIIRGELEVVINDKILNANNIGKIIYDDSISELLDPRTQGYYEVLTAPEDDIIACSYSMFEENDLFLMIKAGNNMKNVVAAVRSTGMKIMDINRLPKTGIYSGVLFMKGDKVNDYFRRMENVSHDKWSPERADDPNDAKNKISSLRTFIKEAIRDGMVDSRLNEMDATGMDEFLPDEDWLEGENNSCESLNGNISIYEIDNVKKCDDDNMIASNVHSYVSDYIPDVDGDIYGPSEGTGALINGNTSTDDETLSTNYSEITVPIKQKKLRVVGSDGNYIVNFVLLDDWNLVKIDFEIYGENHNEKLGIQSAYIKAKNSIIKKQVKIEKNSIILRNLKGNIQYSLDITSDTKESWSLEAKIYGTN